MFGLTNPQLDRFSTGRHIETHFTWKPRQAKLKILRGPSGARAVGAARLRTPLRWSAVWPHTIVPSLKACTCSYRVEKRSSVALTTAIVVYVTRLMLRGLYTHTHTHITGVDFSIRHSHFARENRLWRVMSSIPIASFAIDSDLMKRIWSEVSPSHCFCALVKTSPSLLKVVLNTYDRFCSGFQLRRPVFTR